MPDTLWHTATLGLGGNIGDPVRAMADALLQLDRRDDCSVIAVSRLYRTPPWGKTDQSWFFNACAAVSTTLAPEPLLDACLGIEKDMKRERIERWGPRTIDIDVLTYGDLKQTSERLEVPHPRMTGRGFVMMPLADIRADMIVEGRTVVDWMAAADLTGIEIANENPAWWRDLT